MKTRRSTTLVLAFIAQLVAPLAIALAPAHASNDDRHMTKFLEMTSTLIGIDKPHPVRSDFSQKFIPVKLENCGPTYFQFCRYLDDKGLEYFFSNDGSEQPSDILSTVRYNINSRSENVDIFDIGTLRKKRDVIRLVAKAFSGVELSCWSGRESDQEGNETGKKYHNCGNDIGDYYLTVEFNEKQMLKGFLFTYQIAFFSPPEPNDPQQTF